jgi:integrase/recombinase XerD
MPKNIIIRKGTYWGRFQVLGREYRRSLHVRVEPARRAEGKAIRALERMKGEIEDEIRHGIAPPRVWEDAVISWNDVAPTLVSESTLKRYIVSLKQWGPHLEGQILERIDTARLRELIKVRRDQGASNATIRRDLTAISSVLAHAQDEGWVEQNAALSVNRRRIPERRDPILLPTEGSIKALLDVLPPGLADICAFAIETGMRQDEIVRLDWNCIDLARSVATIHRTKGSKLRTVPLNAEAKAILLRQPKSNSALTVFWRGDGSPIEGASTQFGKSARKLAHRRSDFVRFKFHDLRHLFAVRYLQNGGSIYILQGIMGHGSVKTTEIYLAYLTPDQQQRAKLG